MKAQRAVEWCEANSKLEVSAKSRDGYSIYCMWLRQIVGEQAIGEPNSCIKEDLEAWVGASAPAGIGGIGMSVDSEFPAGI